MRKPILQTMALGGALVLALFAGRRNRRNPGNEELLQRDGFAEIDAYVERRMERLSIPGAVLAIVEEGEISHQRGFGKARPGGGAPTPRTPFFIGSLTKSFTALAVMQLVEAGEIELDAPIRRYLPWFRVADPQASAHMTVRHLLNQTSGLPTSSGEVQLADFDDSPDATERQARVLSTLRLARPPGSAFEYSNANYNLLGLIVEAVGGEPYADYVRERIFTPLSMRHTYTSPAEAERAGLAAGHRYWFAVPVPAPGMPIPRGALPGGMLISSAEDMARYLIAHLNGGRHEEARVLSEAGIEELHRGVAEYNALSLSLGRYGMGWFDDEIGNTKLVWHGGTLPHFGAYMALLPEKRKGVVLLFNACHHWMTPVLADLGTGVAAMLADERPAPVPFVRVIPWALRSQLLIPALQVAGAFVTLRRWRRGDERRQGVRALLPLVPNLLVASTLGPMLSRRRGYLRLYTPDYAWIATVCGSFALVWSVVRTGLVLGRLIGP